ncbi:MAG TPA: AAA family ATPase [Syntrophorhabdaceae bacterium]|nr:AAA family ATPase [Syntrophorhabdaceae bacterium]HQM81785.1 AAA family ATPase [Syntrophorhabdaceae bacterium]
MEIPYLEYFGFTEKPFGMSPDPAFYYESNEHKRAVDYLNFFLSQKEGFALIYGDVGSGKTTVSRIFINSLPRESYNTALILNPVTDDMEFMKELLREFSVQDIPSTNKELYDTLRLFLLEEFRSGKENVLVIDEAQLLSYELLEFIRLLSNIETDKQKILHTIFFAQPEFLEKLKAQNMRHLAQRITVTYGIEPLTLNEVKSYINYRLYRAGSKGPLEFQDRAVRLIHIASKGFPRLINYICDRCLLAIYAQSSHTVDGHVVSKVLLEESISLGSVKSQNDIRGLRSNYMAPAIVIILVVVLGAIGYYLVSTGTMDRFFVKKTVTAQKQATVAQTEPAPKTEAPLKTEAQIKTEAPAKTEAPSKKEEPQPPAAKTPEAKTTPEKPKAESAPQKVQPQMRQALVIKDAANVRIAPGLESLRIGMIFKGATLRVVGEQSDKSNAKWYKVILYENREGWISESVVSVK